MIGSAGKVTYVDAVDTAKMLRVALREAFPGVKFSVRIQRYALGCSAWVRWIDGPSKEAVHVVAGRFGGRDFDALTDSSSPITHVVDGEPTQYGTDYIHLHRSRVSPAGEVEAGR